MYDPEEPPGCEPLFGQHLILPRLISYNVVRLASFMLLYLQRKLVLACKQVTFGDREEKEDYVLYMMCFNSLSSQHT